VGLARWRSVALPDPDEAVREEALGTAFTAVVQAEQGAHYTMMKPKIPVASVTGTNGRMTTTRLLEHVAMTAGLVTAWSATDGVVAQGVMVEPGDYSGTAGVRKVLPTSRVQLAILETARGGLLLNTIGIWM
jgi:cyanophycin synthetase